MIFQLCNICSTSLRMATARTWYFGCALTWNMIMLSRKLVSLASLAKNKNTRHLHGETQRITCAIQTGKCLLPGTIKSYGLRIVHWRTWWKGKKENQCKGREACCWWLFQITPPLTHFCHVRISINYPFPLGHTSFWKSFSNSFFGYRLNAKLSSCLTI